MESIPTKDKISKKWSFVKDDYKIIRILGSGTYGQVTYCKHRVTQQKVAIKFIKGNIKSKK